MQSEYKSPHTFTIGDIQCTLYKDFDFQYNIHDYFMDVDPEEIMPALKRYNINKNPIPSPYVALLVETNNKRILIDTGLGQRQKPLEFKGHQFNINGTLNPSLSISGNLNSIDQVILTHLHPDHAGGLFQEDGDINYPTAEIIVHQEEWDYWTNKYPMGSSPVFDYTVRAQVLPLQDQNLKLIVQDEFEVTAGINLIKIPGHTPGQIAVQLSSKGENLLYISDAWLHPLHIEHLDWRTVFDLDHEEARQSRVRLLEMAYAESMLVQSFHFDFPGLGYVGKTSDGWNWIKQTYRP